MSPVDRAIGPGDEIEKGALPRAIWPDDADDLAASSTVKLTSRMAHSDPN